MPVVVLHEGLDQFEERLLRVAEIGREARLDLEVEHIGRMFAHVVKLVAHAQQENAGFLEFRQLVGTEIMLFREFLHPGNPEANLRHPQGVLVIAQASDPVLDVGLLHKDRVTLLEAAVALIDEARGDVGLRIVLKVMFPVGGGEILVERSAARDESRFEQRRLGADVMGSFGKHLAEHAGGVADFQAQVPERIKDLVGKIFLKRRGRSIGCAVGVKEHHVDVAQRAQFGPSVSAEGDEADGGWGLAVFGPPGFDGAVEEALEQSVHLGRLCFRHDQAGPAGLMKLPDAGVLAFKVGSASGKALSRRTVGVKVGTGPRGGRGGTRH